MDSFSDVFERVKQLCRGEMSEVAYDLWIRELELTALDSSTDCYALIRVKGFIRLFAGHLFYFLLSCQHTGGTAD